jgi:hypothetical protein
MDPRIRQVGGIIVCSLGAASPFTDNHDSRALSVDLTLLLTALADFFGKVVIETEPRYVIFVVHVLCRFLIQRTTDKCA